MTADVTVVGLGPSGWSDVPQETRELLADPVNRVIVRTLEHPAAAHLARIREVVSADSLYEGSETFDQVYEELADLVAVEARAGRNVVLALPGSPWVGERTTRLVIDRAAEAGLTCRVIAAESFLEAAWKALPLDPLERGVKVIDGRNLPRTLDLGVPTLICQVDLPVVLSEVTGALTRHLPPDTVVKVLHDLGGQHEQVETVGLADLAGIPVGPRTTLFVDAPLVGWGGLVETMRRLRAECPWDARQTHESLVPHIVEETFELVDSIAALSHTKDPGEGAFGDLEEELGDVLLQVLFQSVIAAEEGAFDIEDVAESLHRKLVRRHPHVFGDAEAGSAEQVYARWEEIKAAERPHSSSVLSSLPGGLPALQRAETVQRRAATVGFDWEDVAGVVAKVTEEVGELAAAIDDPVRAESELGDLLFAVVNLGRHLTLDPEIALRRAVGRFETRFRSMEAQARLEGLTASELDRLWEQAKRDT